MEEQFFKSALPAQDSSALGDSSLALPAGPNPARSPAAESSVDRTLRVHRQVQLTLARRARRTESSGELRFSVAEFHTEKHAGVFAHDTIV